jgi:hypothetical protein
MPLLRAPLSTTGTIATCFGLLVWILDQLIEIADAPQAAGGRSSSTGTFPATNRRTFTLARRDFDGLMRTIIAWTRLD